jgi:Uma2 family endonuclease
LKAPCRIVGNAGIILPEQDDRYYIADLALTCAEPASQRPYLPEPRLVVEVLARSTAAHDQGVKGEDYRRLPSVQEILFVSSERRQVVRVRREADHWVIEDFIGDASIRLVSVETTVSLSAVYANVSLGETRASGRRRRRGPPASAPPHPQPRKRLKAE